MTARPDHVHDITTCHPRFMQRDTLTGAEERRRAALFVAATLGLGCRPILDALFEPEQLDEMRTRDRHG